MITKHKVLNGIAMIGEMDAAPLLIYLREKENTDYKGMEARSIYRTKIGVVFDAPPPALHVHTNTNRETLKVW